MLGNLIEAYKGIIEVCMYVQPPVFNTTESRTTDDIVTTVLEMLKQAF